jgi:excisionase family DNA binding protein
VHRAAHERRTATGTSPPMRSMVGPSLSNESTGGRLRRAAFPSRSSAESVPCFAAVVLQVAPQHRMIGHGASGRATAAIHSIPCGLGVHLAARDSAWHGNWTFHVHDRCQSKGTCPDRWKTREDREGKEEDNGSTLDRGRGGELACSPAAIRKWLYQRRLSSVKVGRLTRIRANDVEAFVRTSRDSEVAQRRARRVS